MRNTIIGIVIGLVIGITVGVTTIAPHLAPPEGPPGDVSAKGAGGKGATAPLVGPVAKWRLASAFRTDEPHLGELAKRIGTEATRISGGTVEIKVHEPDAIIPVFETFDAVAKGTIDAAFVTSAYWGTKTPAFELFGGIPFGPTADELLAWYEFGGGRKLHQQIYAKRGVHVVACGLVGPRIGGWFRKEITAKADIVDLRVAAAGLGARVLDGLGAKTLPIADGDIGAALKLNVVDSAQGSTPRIDAGLGTARFASHFYLPAWHHPSGLVDLMINAERWTTLPEVHKAQIEGMCGDNLRQGLAESGVQFEAMKALQLKGATPHRWSEDILADFRTTWDGIAQELAKKDPEFRDTWNSLNAFRKNFAIWKELGTP